MKDRRNISQDQLISADLKAKGAAQLESEIKIIESWLADLAETRDDNPASKAARKSYNDMLQSRRDFLNTLKES